MHIHMLLFMDCMVILALELWDQSDKNLAQDGLIHGYMKQTCYILRRVVATKCIRNLFVYLLSFI